MTSLRSSFAFIFLFFVATVYALNFVDCDLLSTDVFNLDQGQLYVHTPYVYERNYYYNFTYAPLQSPVSLVPELANTRPSTVRDITIWLNDALIFQYSKDTFFTLPDEHVLYQCGETNHFIFETYDRYEQSVFVPSLNRTLIGRSEACRYQYELFLYNPPCQTVENLYF